MNEATTKKKRLRWRKQPNERGLAAIGQAERGFDLWYGDEVVGMVRPLGRGRPEGWYFYGSGTNSLNTTGSVPTIGEAKVDCCQYVEAEIAAGRVR